ncbi:biotin/lipoate A/B protein ligase family protein [Brooklawnia sp.]|uniref:lipoate--protein ligase family protein n=1 Tax=Brooklawnia sp. TaxID=2699740 RepID=UPI00311E85A3
MKARGEYASADGIWVSAEIEVVDQRLTRVQLAAAGDVDDQMRSGLGRAEVALQGAAVADVRSLARLAADAWPDAPDGLAATIAIAVRRAVLGATDWRDLTFDVIPAVRLPVATHVALDQVLADDIRAGRRNATFRIWEWDDPAVVIGSFQSVRNEVDPDNAAEYGFQVVRRISGGGAMYMPPGTCITYSLTVPGSLTEGLSFEQSYAFLDAWVLDALAQVGVRARYLPLNDIASDKGKIGGAAQRRFADGTVLHHVTSAYAMDMGLLAKVLRLGREPISAKGTASANKWVDPMCSQTSMPREQVMSSFLESFKSRYRCVDAGYSDDQLARASELVRTKFGADDWTYRVP